MPKPRTREEKELILQAMNAFDEEKENLELEIKSQNISLDGILTRFRNVARRTATTLNVSPPIC